MWIPSKVWQTPLSESCLHDTMKFIQLCLYLGNEQESYLATRVRIYKTLAKKSSQVLPPDEMSILEDIKRCHLQVLIWNGCLNKIVEGYDPVQYGWTFDSVDHIFKPVWYSGSQLPDKTNANDDTPVSSDETVDEPPTKRQCVDSHPEEFPVKQENVSDSEWPSDWESIDDESDCDASDDDFLP